MPLEAAEMALLRVIHASEIPDPGGRRTLAAGRRRRGTPAASGIRPRPPSQI